MHSMKKTKVSLAVNSVLDFKGFDDSVELFKAGEQTDSKGHTQNFTTADLDDMVNNHESFPIVIGHPKVNDPAYGWSAELKREGDSLFGKFENVESQFSDMVENKRFPNRSVRLRKTDNGFQVAHIGFLGAVPPAIPGLKQMEFSADDEGMEFEFSGYSETVMARMLRRMREFLIDQFSIEEADKVLPEWELETITEEAARERAEENKDDSLYNQHQNNDGGTTVPDKNFTKADVDKAVKDALAEQKKDFNSSETDLKDQLGKERKTRLTNEYSGFVDGLIDEGKLTPAFAAGMTDFMLQLSDSTEFEFSQGEGDDKAQTKTNSVDWFKEFVSGMGKTVKLGATEEDDDESQAHNFNAPAGAVVDADRLELDTKARDYAEKHNVDYVEALVAVGA